MSASDVTRSSGGPAPAGNGPPLPVNLCRCGRMSTGDGTHNCRVPVPPEGAARAGGCGE